MKFIQWSGGFMRVELLVVIAIIVALLASPAGATNYYVSTTGSNANAGTSLANPFLTIQQAANVAQAGDNVYVRGGTYRETVTAAHSGTASAPITFQPYQNEPVTVTGLDVLASNWSPYSSSTYQTLVTGGASQVFVGGQMMTEARFPDAGYNNPLHANRATVGSAWVNQPPTQSGITDSALAGTGNWVGAKMAINAGDQWSTWSAAIEGQGGQGGTCLGFQWPYNSDTFHAPTAGNPYYLYGSLNALNAPKEWYYDASASKLYLQAPGSVNPSGQTIEVRKREYGFDLGSQSYVNLQGFCLKAANVRVAGTNNLVNNCQILYPEPLTDATGGPSNPGVQIGGQYNTVQNSEIAYAWGDGVTLSNGHNTVSNNVIHDVAWLGNGAFVNGFGAGGNNTIANNTMYNSGNSGILYGNGDAPNTQIQHNDISRYGAFSQDRGAIYSWSGVNTGTVVAYNRIHDSAATNPGVDAGIYLDNNAAQTSSGVTIHNNLTAGIQTGVALNVSQSDINIYNNTFWGSNCTAVNMQSGDTNIKTYNNLSVWNNCAGTDLRNNWSTSVWPTDPFNNSGAGDYTLKSHYTPLPSPVNYGMADAQHPTDPYTGSAPDAGAFESGLAPWTAGANFKTWTAGNQAAAPLAAALYVTQSGTRATTGSLMVGNTSSTSANSRSFLQFDLSGVVSTTIQSAVLRIYENTVPASAAGSVTLNRVTSAWTNANVSYAQSVDTALPITGFYDPSNLDLYTDINVTSWVQGWLSNSSTNYGLRLCGTEDVTGTAKYFDGFYGVTAPELVITMPEPGDANLDGRVDVLDLAILAANYRKHVTGGWTQADFNNDGVVDVQDLAILAANYRYGLASDVVPAYDGLDAAAIELLSLAGVTVVPEPGTLIMLAAALLGVSAYARRK